MLGLGCKIASDQRYAHVSDCRDRLPPSSEETPKGPIPQSAGELASQTANRKACLCSVCVRECGRWEREAHQISPVQSRLDQVR